jgi:hypothetical protein
MKRYLAVLFILCAVSAGLVLAQNKPVSGKESAALQAERALAAAYAKGDNATVNKLLDSDLSWIDTDGVMMEKPDVLRANLKPLVPVTAETQITEHSYADGKVVWIQDNVGKDYAAHTWVLRPGGYRLLQINEISTGQPPTPIYRPQYDIPCDNPCNMVPYKPISKSEQASLDAWQDQEGKNGPGHHDMHMGKNVVVISQTTTTPRPSATAPGPTPVTPRPAGSFVSRAAPALWVRSWDFGDAVVAIMIQPTDGGKAYWSSRVYGNHNGFWVMEESYHNTIKAAPLMVGVPPKDQWPPAPPRRGAAPAEGSN